MTCRAISDSPYTAEANTLRNSGEFHWRGEKDGVPTERHLNDPAAIQALQAAGRCTRSLFSINSHGHTIHLHGHAVR